MNHETYIDIEKGYKKHFPPVHLSRNVFPIVIYNDETKSAEILGYCSYDCLKELYNLTLKLYKEYLALKNKNSSLQSNLNNCK